MPAKEWQIESRYVEYCNCDYGCPCETMANPTQGHCTGLVTFHIDRGNCGDVRLDGLSCRHASRLVGKLAGDRQVGSAPSP